VGVVVVVTGNFIDLTAEPRAVTPKLRWLNSQKGQSTILHNSKTLASSKELEANSLGTTSRNVVDGIPISVNQITFRRLKFVNDTLVFGQDSSGSIWVSYDAFMTWTKTRIDPKDSIQGIFVSPVKPSVILFLGGRSQNANNASWVTFDGGLNFERINSSNSMGNFLWHPTVLGWGMGFSRNILYMTTDFGQTYTPIRDHLEFATWCHAGMDGVTKNRICMITDVTPDELGLPMNTDDERVGPSRFVRTEDLGQTISVMFAMEVSYLIIHPYFFFVIATDPRTGMADLFASNDHGQVWRNTKLPAEQNIPYLYDTQIIDDSAGSI